MATRPSQDPEELAVEPRSFDLRDYWLIIRRRWVLVLVLALIAAALGAGYAMHAGAKYSATAEVVVNPATQGTLSQPSQTSQLPNIATEQVVAQSAPVVNMAAGLLHTPAAGLQVSAGKNLSVAVPTGASLLQITWKGGSARAAQAGANAFAQSYLQYRHQQLAALSQTTQAVISRLVRTQQDKLNQLSAQLSQLGNGAPQHQSLLANFNQLTGLLSTEKSELATLPTYNESGGSVILAALPAAPTGLGRSATVVLGGFLGLLIGMIAAFVRDLFDDRINGAAQLAHAVGAATLAVLPPTERRRAMPVRGDRAVEPRYGAAMSTVVDPGGRAADAVRALRSTLVAVGAHRDVRTILVASADPSVSASRVVAELGLAMAESGRHVLLLGADMRNSFLPQIFDVPNETGLSNLLVAGGNPEAVTRQPKSAGGAALSAAVGTRLALLPSGSQVAQPLAVLDSTAMARLLRIQREAYEFVLLDSPPATAAADVFALAAQVDGVVVVAREGRTRSRALADLHDRLEQVGAHVVGGVLIGTSQAGRHRTGRGQPLADGPVPLASAARPPASPAGHAGRAIQPAPSASPDNLRTARPVRSGSAAQRHP